MSATISPFASISPLADIECSSRGSSLYIGADTIVDSFVKIKFAGGLGDVRIGDRVNLNSGCVLYSGNGIDIGDDVAIAANCVIAPVNHSYELSDVTIRNQGFMPSRGGVRIGNDVWIGAGTVLLDGADIGDGSVVGALSLVRERVEPYSICVGNPLRVRGKRV